jgi:hypothetical protein
MKTSRTPSNDAYMAVSCEYCLRQNGKKSKEER